MPPPDSLCIGAQKAGTTWLHRMLSQHPNVSTGPLKEYQFFTSKFIPSSRDWTSAQINTVLERKSAELRRSRDEKSQHYANWLDRLRETASNFQSTEWYEEAFSHEMDRGCVKIDITPSYLALPPEGIRFIREYLGNIRILVIIRDPFQREMSQLRMTAMRATKRAKRNKGIRLQLSTEDWRMMAERNLNEESGNSRGDYETFFRRWWAEYPQKNFLFLPFRDIQYDPSGFVRSVERHLGIEPHSYTGLTDRVFSGRSFDVPPSVETYVRERVARQYPFLESEFDKDFLKRI